MWDTTKNWIISIVCFCGAIAREVFLLVWHDVQDELVAAVAPVDPPGSGDPDDEYIEEDGCYATRREHRIWKSSYEDHFTLPEYIRLLRAADTYYARRQVEQDAQVHHETH